MHVRFGVMNLGEFVKRTRGGHAVQVRDCITGQAFQTDHFETYGLGYAPEYVHFARHDRPAGPGAARDGKAGPGQARADLKAVTPRARSSRLVSGEYAIRFAPGGRERFQHLKAALAKLEGTVDELFENKYACFEIPELELIG